MINTDILMHYGVGKLDGAPGRGSGRYPLGSGDNPHQRSANFLNRIDELKKEGLSEKEIAKAVGCIGEDGEGNTRILRAEKAMARAEVRSAQVAIAKRLRAEGMPLAQIANEMGFKNDSSVRSLLNEDAEARMNAAMKTAEFLKQKVKEKGMIEVGAGVEKEVIGGVSREKMKEALTILEKEGYPTYGGRVEQTTNPGKFTTISVLCPPGTEHKEIFELDKIHSVSDYQSVDGGDTFKKKFVYPESMDSKRLMVRTGDEGGVNKDGVIELRRGTADLNLGDSRYAQVRILVDGTHYLKGMAVYGDDKDFPKGVDVIFNSNKNYKNKLEHLKEIHTEDPNNPFGSLIKEGGQSYYTGKDGRLKLSLINKRAEEGDWDDWKDKVSAQFLAKQPYKLAKQQLELTKANKRAEFDEINALTNPTLKKHLLKEFSDSCDSDAVHLKAASLPGQKYKVLIPMTTMRDNECYCPSLKDGTTVALVRYPHGGTFEIPVLKVNNKNAEGKRVITPTGSDAIGITKKNADRLSGADFDGDTVMVIPFKRGVKINSTKPLDGLADFDTKMAYPYREGCKIMSKKNTQIEMGKISNLITDMTIMGAKENELARAVRHSMVVIDAHKHKLDYKQSEIDNDIASLKKKYQLTYDENGNPHTSAATLISRAKSQTSVLKRQGSPRINEDGSLSYKLADNLTYEKNGKTITKTQKSTKMAEAKDARELISTYNTRIEHLYADFANYHKALANEARKTMINTKEIKYSASAKKTYQKEYDSLNSKLMIAEANRPKERMANIIANSKVNAIKQANPDMEKKDLKKVKQREITEARNQVGAQRYPIKITEQEYKAIQSGAISPSKLTKILKYADKDELYKMAMPKDKKGLSNAQVAQIKAMKNAGYTIADIAERFGVSASTISKASVS